MRWARVEPGAVWIRGPDARRWGNGLFSNDVRSLPVGGWNRSAILDDRAHVGGFLDLLCVEDDALLAIVDGLSAAAFVERFDRYLLFDKVELEVPGFERLALLDGTPAAPAPGRWARAGAGWTWGHRRGPPGSVDWIGPAGQGPGPVGEPVGAEVLLRERVRARIPAFPDDTGDRRLPHELGRREELLHFEKGCYLGQEIVHRVDVMGQVRRLLVVVATARPVPAGSEVRVGPEVVGALTSPCDAGDGTGLGLCVIRRPHDAPGTAVLVDGVPGTVLAA